MAMLTQEEATKRIAQCFNRGVNGALKQLWSALTEAKTYTVVGNAVPEQQAYIERLTKLEKALEAGAQNPLGEFNWDFV